LRPAREEKEEVGGNATTARTTSKSSLIIRMYVLKSSETRRQHPKRLRLFFDCLDLTGKLEEQAAEYSTLAGDCNDLP
jgi:hypothetical protein